jgi:hypothetical protein
VTNDILRELASVDAAESSACAAARERGFATEDELRVMRECVTRRATLSALLKVPTGESVPAEPAPTATTRQYVTLNQMASIVQRSKRTLEKLLTRSKNPLPEPDVSGGGGKPNEWDWRRVRPWLQLEFSKLLPADFPGLPLSNVAERN